MILKCHNCGSHQNIVRLDNVPFCKDCYEDFHDEDTCVNDECDTCRYEY